MNLDIQKKSILKILGGNDKNIKLRKIRGVVLVAHYGPEREIAATSSDITVKVFQQVIRKKSSIPIRHRGSGDLRSHPGHWGQCIASKGGFNL